MDDRRRAFVKSMGIAAACGAGLLRPAGAWAAWNQQAFDARSLDGALAALGVGGATRSSAIAIDAPEFAENGAFVPVEIRSDAPGTDTIALFVERNPWPYIARFDVSKGALPAVALRVRVAETAPVRVVVTAGGRHFYGAKAGDKLAVTWEDNRGLARSDEASVSAG
jgi:sulfur-oxidizing protein SoxY